MHIHFKMTSQMLNCIVWTTVILFGVVNTFLIMLDEYPAFSIFGTFTITVLSAICMLISEKYQVLKLARDD